MRMPPSANHLARGALVLLYVVMHRAPPTLDINAEIERIDRLRAELLRASSPPWIAIYGGMVMGAVILAAGMLFAKYVL